MGIGALPFSSPFYSGTSSTTTLVPDAFHCAIDGRPYMFDTASEDFMHGPRSVRATREQSDTGSEASEASLSRDFVWRRSIEDWELGAGQRFFDKSDSTSLRFYNSLGIDVWTKNQFSLLPSTDLKSSSTSTNQFVVPAGSYLYKTAGSTVARTQDVTADSPSWTSLTGNPTSTSITDICSDGYNTYVAYGSNGIYLTNTGGTTLASYVTGTVTTIDYVKGRLMAASSNSVYNITSAVTSTGNALPTALLTHANPGFTWSCFGEGPGYIYMGGYAGDKSLIYKVTIREDGTALDSPTVAGELPDGEKIYSIQGYLGFLILGLANGFRVASLNADGSIGSLGARVVTASQINCFEPQERFIWYGLTNFDSSNTGLGRIDLSQTNAGGPLVPAYASDLMVSGQGEVLSVCTFQNKRVFTVSGLGVYAEDTPLVSSGWIDTGSISFGVQEKKVAQTVDFKTLPLRGSVSVSISTEDGGFTPIGGSSAADSTAPIAPLELANRRGHFYNLKFTLSRDSGTTSTGPTVTRILMRAYPVISRSGNVTVPLLIRSTVINATGSEYEYDVKEEYDALVSLAATQNAVTYQELGETFSATIIDYEWQRDKVSRDRTWWDGTMTLLLNLGE